MAVEDSGLDLEKPILIECNNSGSGLVVFILWRNNVEFWLTKDLSVLAPLVPMMIVNMAAGQISITLGAKGPNYTVVSACASGTNAVGDALILFEC